MPRLSILDRYLLHEYATGGLAAVVVLLVVFTGSTFAAVVGKVATGQLAGGVMFTVLGLHLVSTLQTTLPMGMFLGILLGLGRMYRDSEMHVLAASGFGALGLLKPTAIFGAGTAVLVALVALWLGPLAVRTSHREVVRANRSVLAVGLEASRFTPLAGRGGILFAGKVSPDGTRLGKLFFESEHTGKDGVTHISVTTAERGELLEDGRGSRFVGLADGRHYDIKLGRDDWRLVRFRHAELALSQPATDTGLADRPDNQRPTLSLAADPDPTARAELQWRIAIPCGSLVLAMLALPLARQRPRSSHVGRTLIGVLAYLTLMNLMVLARAWIASGRLSATMGMWWILLPVFAGAVWAFARQYRAHKPRDSARAGA